jgi:CheY-like chemotaxis protein
MRACVLLVEDYDDSRNMFAECLGLEGFQVLTAADGLEGLRLAKERLPDAIVLDIGLPKLDGFSLLNELQKDTTTARIPVLVMSAYSGKDLAERALASGASAALKKPCMPDEIVDALRKHCRVSAQ